MYDKLACASLSLRKCVCACMCTCMRVYVRACVWLCEYVYVRACVHMTVCVCVCVWLYVYDCVCVWMYDVWFVSWFYLYDTVVNDLRWTNLWMSLLIACWCCFYTFLYMYSRSDFISFLLLLVLTIMLSGSNRSEECIIILMCSVASKVLLLYSKPLWAKTPLRWTT